MLTNNSIYAASKNINDKYKPTELLLKYYSDTECPYSAEGAKLSISFEL